MDSHEPASLTGLPNELILHILICLRTAELMPLASTCRRFHDLIVRILGHRLRLAASLHSHSLLLEAYHPSQRLTEPPYPCIYLGTDGLDIGLRYAEPLGSLPPGQRLRELSCMYSKFRPRRRQVERANRMKHPAGDIPGSRTYRSPNNRDTSSETPSTDQPVQVDREDIQDQGPAFEPVIQNAHLEAGVRFTQLCADTTVTIAGPMLGLFIGYQYVEKGVLRVFRDWLAERAAIGVTGNPGANDEMINDFDGADIIAAATPPLIQVQGSNDALKAPKSSSVDVDVDVDVRSDQGVLWVGNRHSVGIRFGVRQPRWRPQHSPILVRTDEELPVSYEIEYEELLVRTTDLLLATEKADDKQMSNSGKAIVIGSWSIEQ